MTTTTKTETTTTTTSKTKVAERYDLDGLNLDFGRHPPFLPVGQQWEQREALTDFVQQVRLMLQTISIHAENLFNLIY